MDHINMLLKRCIIKLLDRPITNYNFVVIFCLMVSRKSWMEGKWNYELLNMLESSVFGVLFWPLRLTFSLVPLIMRAISCPDNNLLHILAAFFTLLAATVMLVTNILLQCSLFPEVCYKEFEGETEERSLVTKIMFAVLQLIIIVDMGLAIWFLRSIKKPLKTAMTQFMIYIRNNIFTVLGTANFLLLIAHYEMQTDAIYVMLAQMMLKRLSQYFTVNPIVGFESEQFPSSSHETNERAENPWPYRYVFNDETMTYQYLEVIATGDEDANEVDYLL